MGRRQSISSVIMTARLDPVSLESQTRAASRCSSRLITHHAPMRSVNAFSYVSDENVSITCLSFKRSSWIVSFTPLSSTATEPGRIKALDNSFQNSTVSLFDQITMGARSSPSQSWVDDTTSIAEVLELCRVCEAADGSVGGSALHLGSRRPSFLFCRFSRMNAANKRCSPSLSERFTLQWESFSDDDAFLA